MVPCSNETVYNLKLGCLDLFKPCLDDTCQVDQPARLSTPLPETLSPHPYRKASTECYTTLLQIVEQDSTGNHFLQMQDSLESQ